MYDTLILGEGWIHLRSEGLGALDQRVRHFIAIRSVQSTKVVVALSFNLTLVLCALRLGEVVTLERAVLLERLEKEIRVLGQMALRH